MHRRPNVLTRACAAVGCVALLGSWPVARPGSTEPPGRRERLRDRRGVSHAPVDNTPAAPVSELATFDGLQVRAQQATADAARSGAPTSHSRCSTATTDSW